MSQPAADTEGFEWTTGIIIAIASAAIALIALPIVIYLILRWRDLERKRVMYREAGLRRRSDRRAAKLQIPMAGGSSERGMVDLAMWSPISARRDGYVVLPELAYHPGEKVRICDSCRWDKRWVSLTSRCGQVS
jgi:hypothetical protein